MPTLTFASQKLSLEINEGTELKQLPDCDPRVPLQFGCRQGSCATCLIRVTEGMDSLSPVTKEEKATLHRLKLDAECRLACQCAVMKGQVVVEGVYTPSN